MIYHYKCVNEQGKLVEDVMAATNQKEVADHLKSQGLVILEIQNETDWQKATQHFSLANFRFGSKISLSEKVALAKHLATMIKAGLPLAESIDILSKESNNPAYKKILDEAKYGLESGKSLSACFSRYPDIFDKSFINMLKAGEVSGRLTETLEHIADKLQQDNDLISKIKSSMMYPAVILVTLILVGVMMLVVVVPKIADVFYRLKVSLPLPTKILLFMSNILVKYPLISIPVTILLIIILIVLAKSKFGKRFFQYLVHWIPFVKKLAKYIDLSRFNHSLALLLKSGVPIIEAMDIAADTLSNEKVRKAVLGFKAKISEGVNISEVFRSAEGFFPLIMIRMISVGEKTGNLDQILEELGAYYRKESEQTLQVIANLVEPILMFIIGIVIGAMILAIIGPMYQIVSQISNQ